MSSTRHVVMVWILVLIWFFATVVKSICNKLILSQNYDYPLVILCSQFFCVSLACYGLLAGLQRKSWRQQQRAGAIIYSNSNHHRGGVSSYPPVIKRQPAFYSLIMPYILSNISGHILSQLALFLLPIYMLKLTKSLEPLCTVFFARIWLKDVYHPLVYLSLLPIVLGVGLTTVDKIEGAWWGMLIGFLSAAAYSLCRIFAKQVFDAEADGSHTEEKTHGSHSWNESGKPSSTSGLSALHSPSLPPPPSLPHPSSNHPTLSSPCCRDPDPDRVASLSSASSCPPAVLSLASSPLHTSSSCSVTDTNGTGVNAHCELTLCKRDTASNKLESELGTDQESQRLICDNDIEMSNSEADEDETQELPINEDSRLVKTEAEEMGHENSSEMASQTHRHLGPTGTDPITFSLHTNLVSFLLLLAYLLISSLANYGTAPAWPSYHIALLLLANGLSDIIVSLGALYLLVFFDATTVSVISIARYHSSKP